MKWPKLRELREAIRSLLSPAYTSSFPFKPHEPFERFRGRPYFHEKECIGCGACTQVCPTKALRMEDTVANKKGTRVLSVRWDICIFCGNCQAHCPTLEGITLSREFAFSVTERPESLTQSIEKELLLCSCCSEPIVPVEQFRWVAKRLGPLAFSNASLVSALFSPLGPSSLAPASPRQEQQLYRADRLRILCPRCRRETVVES